MLPCFNCFGALLFFGVLTSFQVGYLGLVLGFSCYQALRLFLVWDSEGEDDREDTTVEELFQCLDDSDGEDDTVKKKSKRGGKKRKRTSSSRSVSSKSSRSSKSSKSSKSSSASDSRL